VKLVYFFISTVSKDARSQYNAFGCFAVSTLTAAFSPPNLMKLIMQLQLRAERPGWVNQIGIKC